MKAEAINNGLCYGDFYLKEFCVTE